MSVSFYCNKRFDISFSDFHKLIKLVLPSEYSSRETRGIYKKEYQPCNIIEIIKASDESMSVTNIYCWLSQKGLTVLADTELSASLCIEVLKNVKQNAEDYRMLTFDLLKDSQKDDILNVILQEESYLVYKQINTSESIEKFLIREYVGDEVQLDFYHDKNVIRVSGSLTSLFTFVQLLIEKTINQLSRDTQNNPE